MNEFLADIYNTRETIGATQDNSDVEKLAEAQLLDEALRAEGVDIDKLPGETILKLAHQLLGDDSALVKAAAEEGAAHESGESAEKEEGEQEEAKEEAAEEKQASEETFEEKVAQADFLGRVMAHSYWNEKTNIEKTAAMPESLKKGLEAAGRFGSSVGSKAKAFGGKAKAFGGKAVGAAKAGAGKAKETGKKGFEWAKAHPKTTAGIGAGAAAVGGGAAYMAHKKKKASAIDLLAEKRAMEWAEAHGLLEQPEATDEMKLAAAVDQRAVELLAEAGIDVNAVEASTQE